MFVLASGSPRRRQLLEAVGLRFRVRPADVDESVRPGEAATSYVARLARRKADATTGADGPVLAADTTVELDGEILGKPHDDLEAASMLRRLSGRDHRVHTGVAVDQALFVVTTKVRFVSLTDAVIDWYVATGEPVDKAGAYAIQGAGGVLVATIDGSFSNVVGLPMAETVAALQAAGVAVFDR